MTITPEMIEEIRGVAEMHRREEERSRLYCPDGLDAEQAEELIGSAKDLIDFLEGLPETTPLPAGLFARLSGLRAAVETATGPRR